MQDDFKQNCYQVVEAQVTTAGTVVQFPDVPQLRNDSNQRITIKMIELITDNVLTKSLQNNATANATVGQLKLAVLVLYDQGWNKLYQLPLLMLNHVASDPAAFIPYSWNVRRIDNWNRVDWNKSQIQFVAAPTPTYAIMLGVTYVREQLDPSTGALEHVDK